MPTDPTTVTASPKSMTGLIPITSEAHPHRKEEKNLPRSDVKELAHTPHLNDVNLYIRAERWNSALTPR